jgi:hypothetical protein
MATIPLSWNDPMFNGIAASDSVEIQNGGALSNYSSANDGPIATVLLDGSATLNDVRINSNEGVRIGGSGNINISNSFIETTGLPGDHADGIQAYSPGGVGNVTVTNTTIVTNASNDNAGFFVADSYSGNFTFNNVVFDGGLYGLRINADAGAGHTYNVALNNVYFIQGSFTYDPFLIYVPPGYGGAQLNITEWNNVRWATIVNGQLVPGALIAPPQPVEGGTTPPSTTPNAPTIASFSPDTGVVGDGITSANKLDVKGTADAGSTITVYDGSTKLGTATADSTGSWDYITSVLTNAKHVLTATETNSSGQTSAASAALTVTVDTHVPAAPVLVSDTVVNTNHVQLSGTAEANSAITVYDGTTVVGTGTASSTGAWSVTTSALSSGAQPLTATATDAAGTVSAVSQPLDPVVPGSTPTPTPPAIPTIVSFSPDTGVVGDHITDHNSLTLSGTAVAGSTVNVFDGTTEVGTATANSSGQWSFTTHTLSDGTHKLTATDTDSGHTSAASAAFSVTVDTHVPAAPTMAVYSQAGAAVGSATTLNDLVLKGTAEANSTIDIFDAGKQIGTATTSSAGTWSFDTGHLANGSHSFTSTAIDVAGTSSAASAADTVAVTAPSTPPPAPKSIDFTNVSYSSWNDTATIKGTADAYSQVKLYDGTVSLGTVTASANGTWSLTNSHLSDTLHTITAQEVDSSGHVIATSSGAAMIMGSNTSTLTGTGGDDFLYSSSSQVNDTFVFASNFGHSTVQGFTTSGPGQDTIQFSKTVFDSFASVLSHAQQVGQNVVISAGSDTLTLTNTKLSALNSHDFHFA